MKRVDRIPRFFRVGNNNIYIGLSEDLLVQIKWLSFERYRKVHVVFYRDAYRVQDNIDLIKKLNKMSKGKKVVLHLIGYDKTNILNDYENLKVYREPRFFVVSEGREYLFDSEGLSIKDSLGIQTKYIAFDDSIVSLEQLSLDEIKWFLYDKKTGWLCNEEWSIGSQGLMIGGVEGDTTRYKLLIGRVGRS